MYIERYLAEIASSGTASETAFYTPLSLHIFRGLLNYPVSKCLLNVSGESGIPDVRLRSLDDDSEWVVCEAKLDDNEVRGKARCDRIWRDQVVAKHYIGAETVYVLICSPRAFRVLNTKHEVVAGVDLDPENNVLRDVRTGESLPLIDAELREALALISSRASEERRHYEQFRRGELDGGYIDLTADTVGLLRPVFDYALRELKAYCRECYQRLRDDYEQARRELDQVMEQLEMAGTEAQLRERVLNHQRYLRRKHRLPIQLFEEDYPQFKHDQMYAGTQQESHFEDIFVTDTAYVALTRLFFVRICEDVGLTTRKVSYDGVGLWRRFVEHIKDSYKDLLEVAYSDAAHVYSRLFEATVFDWYGAGNGRLNDILERILFRLNAFSFAAVDRDVLGGIYQYFRPRAERKRMGEYYTPEEVVDYILVRTGVAGDPDILTKRILDPSCGSFTFGVRAVSHLLLAGSHLTARHKIGAVQRCLVGRDINPFAVFLSHLSLLFTMLDVYRQAKNEQADFAVSGFDVANVNSLAGATGQAGLAIPDDERGEMIEQGAYDYLVGNPPFVRNERLPQDDRAALEEMFSNLRAGNTDLAACFLYSAVSAWVKEGGTVGMVAPIGLANAANAQRLRAELALYTIYEIVSLEWMAKELFPDADIIPILLFVKRQTPSPGHKVVVVTGLAKKTDLAEAVLAGPFRDAHVSEIDYEHWKTISPTGDWPLDITSRDIPVLRKLSERRRMESAADAHYGIKLGSAGAGAVRRAGSRDVRETEVPMAKGQHLCAFGMSDPEEVIDLARTPEVDDPGLWADMAFYGANRLRRNETGINGTTFRDNRLIEEFTPSDTLCCLMPQVYTTLVAAVVDPLSVAANNSALVVVPRECSAPLLAAVINSRVSRYYAFLTMRAAILLRRRSTWYPRTIANLPWPTFTVESAQRLHNLAKEAADISEQAQRTELDAYLEAMHAITDRATSGILGVRLADPTSVIDVDDLASTPPLSDVLEMPSGTIIGPDADTLLLVRMAALASGVETVDNHLVQDLPVPSQRDARACVARAVCELAMQLETGKVRMELLTEEMDEIVAGCLGLIPSEHDVIRQRCAEFPLSVTVGRPRYVWSPDRKRQARRTYEAGERYH